MSAINILSNYKTDNSLMSRAAAGLQSFIEYASSYRQKIIEFTTETVQQTNDQVLSIPIHHTNLNKDVVGYITRQQYQDCLNNTVDNVMVRINDGGDVTPVSSDDILNAVESEAQDLALQSEFCRAAIGNAEITKQDFCSLISAKYEGLAKEKVSHYLDLIEEKSAANSLKNLFSTMRLGSLTKKTDVSLTDEYIEISDAATFTGENVWIVAMTNLGNTIAGFFNVVWKGILHIGEFLHDILNGLIKFGKWLLSKMFRQFTTNWDTTTRVAGVSDLPIMQIPVAKWTRDEHGKISFSSPDWLDKEYANYGSAPIYAVTKMDTSYSTYLHNNASHHTFYYGSTTATNVLFAALKKMIIRTLGDGDDYEYLTEIEVTMPTHAVGLYKQQADDNNVVLCDWSLRLGADENGNIWLRVFPIFDPTYLNNTADNKIAYALNWSWTCAQDYYSALNPILVPYKRYIGARSGDSSVIKFLDNYYSIINFPSDFHVDDIGPFDLVGNMNWQFNAKTFLESVNFVFDDTDGTSYPADTIKYFIAICTCYRWLLPYMIMNSNGLDYCMEHRADGGSFPSFFNIQCFLNGYIWTGHYPADDQGLHQYDSGPYDTIESYTEQELLDYCSYYRPYATQELLPVVAHYQTLAEQAQEIENAIIVVAVVAAVAFAAWKFHKFKVKRQNLLTIQQGTLDNLSWNLGANPTEAELNQFRALQKRVKRTSRLNGILGIGSGSSVTNSTFDLVGALSDQVKKLRNGDSNSPISLDSIKLLITGPSNQ